MVASWPAVRGAEAKTWKQAAPGGGPCTGGRGQSRRLYGKERQGEGRGPAGGLGDENHGGVVKPWLRVMGLEWGGATDSWLVDVKQTEPSVSSSKGRVKQVHFLQYLARANEPPSILLRMVRMVKQSRL
jgi:hypothetical protein